MCSSDLDIRNHARKDYGNRVGIWRLMEVMEKHKMRGTVAFNGQVGLWYPRIMQAMKDLKWELMGHGMTNSLPLAGMILNAGILIPDRLENLDPADLRRQFEVNALAPLLLVRALLANLPVEAEPYGLRYPLTRLEKGMYALQKLFEPAPGITVALQLPVLRPGTPFSGDVEALLKNPRVRADYSIGIRDGVTGTLRFLAPRVEIQEGVLRLAA